MIVTTAVPAAVSWLVTTAPNDALSPTARKRGNVGFSVSGLLMRISLSPDPKRELAVARDRHDAIRRQRLRQLDVDVGVAVRVGRDRSEPERQHAEVLPQRAGAGVGAAAAAVGIALRRQHARG